MIKYFGTRPALLDVCRGFVAGELTKLSVGVAIESPHPLQEQVQPRDFKKLAFVQLQSPSCVIVRFGVDSAIRWRLIRCDADHLCLPFGTFFVAGIDGLFDICKQIVIVSLKGLVIPRRAAKIKYELSGAYCSDGYTDGHLVNAKPAKEVTDRSRSKHDNGEVENPVPQLKETSPGCVVERVSKRVEAQILNVSEHLGHLRSLGGLAGFSRLFDGCRTPIDMPRAAKSFWLSPDARFDFPVFDAVRLFFAIAYFFGLAGAGLAGEEGKGWRGPGVLFGWRTPALFCSCEADGCLTPYDSAKYSLLTSLAPDDVRHLSSNISSIAVVLLASALTLSVVSKGSSYPGFLLVAVQDATA